jgi:acetyl esterase/lipase
VAAALRDDPDAPHISAALLIYAVFDFAALDGALGTTVAAGEEFAEAGEKLVELMVGSYLGSDRSAELLADPRVSPIHAASKLPPTHVMVGSADGLVAQAAAFVEALEREGVEHEYVVYEGMPHGFAQMEFFPPARESIDRMLKFLGKHLQNS